MTRRPGEKSGASADRTRDRVRERYGRIASGGSCCSGSAADGSCGQACSGGCCDVAGTAVQNGYSAEDLASLPSGSNLGLGCGHPTAIAGIESGQAVLDLGSGAGVDCFLAAKKVGATGSVIGVDMTPAMVTRARELARQGGYTNVDFRLGEIEHLPVGDATVDVVISNCVIVLAPEKGPVYREVFRVLRPGGEMVVSDMVATRPIEAKERADAALWSSCASGAREVSEVKAMLRHAGFVRVRVDLRPAAPGAGPATGEASLGVVSADVRAQKPAS